MSGWVSGWVTECWRRVGTAEFFPVVFPVVPEEVEVDVGEGWRTRTLYAGKGKGCILHASSAFCDADRDPGPAPGSAPGPGQAPEETTAVVLLRADGPFDADDSSPGRWG